VLDDVSLTSRDEIVGLLGARAQISLLRIVSAHFPSSASELSCQPVDVRRWVAMVFRASRCFPAHRARNVELGLRQNGDKTKRKARVESDRFIDSTFESAFRRNFPVHASARCFARRLSCIQYSLDGRAFSALDVLTAETLRTTSRLWVEDACDQASHGHPQH